MASFSFWLFLILFVDGSPFLGWYPFSGGDPLDCDRHLKENMYMLNELQCSSGWNAATELDHHGFRSKAFATIFERNCITSLLVPTVTLNQWSSTKGVKLFLWLPKHAQVLQLSLQPLPPVSWKNIGPLVDVLHRLSSKHLPNVVQAVGESPVKNVSSSRVYHRYVSNSEDVLLLKEMVEIHVIHNQSERKIWISDPSINIYSVSILLMVQKSG